MHRTDWTWELEQLYYSICCGEDCPSWEIPEDLTAQRKHCILANLGGGWALLHPIVYSPARSWEQKLPEWRPPSPAWWRVRECELFLLLPQLPSPSVCLFEEWEDPAGKLRRSIPYLPTMMYQTPTICIHSLEHSKILFAGIEGTHIHCSSGRLEKNGRLLAYSEQHAIAFLKKYLLFESLSPLQAGF